ncbi:MAG: DNA translocase FtsK, partial [Patescibacteria group bacterium]
VGEERVWPGDIAAAVLLIALFLIALMITFNTSFGQLANQSPAFNGVWARLLERLRANVDDDDFVPTDEVAEAEEELATDSTAATADPDGVTEVVASAGHFTTKAINDSHQPTLSRRFKKIDIPLDLLSDKQDKPLAGDIGVNQERIKTTLENFGIEVEMGEVSVGPTVAQYTLKPKEGVKLSQITTLHNDLALALAAHPIRIEAPIPGKSLVGIEVPNQNIATVTMREMLVSKEFAKRKTTMSLPIGKDVAGKVWLADLSVMPHLLIAGATGSGKSICINTVITSLLYQNSPNTLRFIMVDPKRVELSVYNGIPHLLTPVVTDAKKIINALKWTIAEMDRRYELLARTGWRDIKSFNQSSKQKIPYLVFIVDEMADLMQTSGSEVEGYVIRLAQLARAVGIHLILATQRPSVDVITGLIKANITSRIAFAVASSTDSRTILDFSGAEKLLGRGDMLYISATLSSPKRLQGAYVSEDETRRLVEYIKGQSGEPDYDSSVTEKPAHGVSGLIGGDDDDELLAAARDLVVSAGKASASYLQRRLKIGYARAARILDLLEAAGVIGPADGAKPRDILVGADEPTTTGRYRNPTVNYYDDEAEEAETVALTAEDAAAEPAAEDDEVAVEPADEDDITDEELAADILDDESADDTPAAKVDDRELI